MKTMVCQVLMLSTNQKANTCLYKHIKNWRGDIIHNSKLEFTTNSTLIHNIHLLNSGKAASNSVEKYEFYNLYFLSNNRILEGEYCYRNWRGIEPFFVGEMITDGKRVEATTDNSLKFGEDTPGVIRYKSLPQIPEAFIQAYIKAYNEGNPITEVQIELEDNGEEEWFGDDYNGQPGWLEKWEVKTRKDNTVIIHPIKTYSRSDVEQLCYQAFINHQCIDGKIIPSKALDLIKPFKKWFEENVS